VGGFDLASSFGYLLVGNRLVSGPGIAAEGHVKDPNVVVRAQVSMRPLRMPIAFGLEGEVPEEDDAGKSLTSFLCLSWAIC
jgi:hypothetical protein